MLLLPLVLVVAMNFNLYVQAKSNNVPIGLIDFALFRLKKISPELMLKSVIRLHKSGIKIDIDKIQCHILSGGDINAVVEAVISSTKSKLPYSFDDLCCIDLAGRDVVMAVHAFVNPVMINCPGRESGQKYIIGVAQDGIRLGVTVKVTVRADIKKLVGGAGEKTVKARVGEGVISAIGGVHSHKTILEKPELISQKITNAGLLTNTAFLLESIDILEVEVIDNIGAKIAYEQSDADKRTAEAAAEATRVEALATKQEMKARKKGMQAQLIYNQAELPNAMAGAFNEGNLGVKDCPLPEVFVK